MPSSFNTHQRNFVRFSISILAILLPAVAGPGLAAQDFSATITEGCAPLHVKFSTTASGTYIWNFGKSNNNTSNLQEPSVTFDEPGIYTISLSINGGAPVTKVAFIKVYSPPVVDFDVDYTPGCAPVDVLFTNKSSSVADVPITTYQWIFGDGASYTTTTNSSISHSYNLPGDHAVTLLAKNDNLPGCVTAKVSSTESNIKVYDIVSKFSATTFFCSPPASVQFNNSSTGPGQLSYSWDFGGLGVSSDLSPAFIFTELGNYNVSLLVKGDFNCSASSTQVIHVGTNSFNIISDKDKICAGDEVKFSVAEGAYLNSWAWNFGNGVEAGQLLEQTVKYENAGTYTVKLNASTGNCNFILTKKIEVFALPVPGFTVTPKCNKTVTFTNTATNSVSWLWDFGDGASSTEKNPEHTFSTAGEYNIKLKAINALGCAVELDSPREIQVYENPQASIFPSQEINCNDHPSLSGCAPFTIQFQNATDPGLPIASVNWSFGDGRTSSMNNPEIVYTTPGTFDVTLNVKAVAGCSSIAQVKVHVFDPQQTSIPDISVDNADACVGEIVTLKVNTPFNYPLCWEPETNIFMTGNEIKYIFHKSTGERDIKVKVPGCSNTRVFTKAVFVKEPKIDFAYHKYCGDPNNSNAPTAYQVDFLNVSTDKPNLIYSWDFGDGTTSSDRNPPRHTYPIKPDESVNYTISLRIQDASTQCDVTASRSINIHELLADFDIRGIPADNTDPLNAIKACKSDSIEFNDRSRFATSWIWDFGDLTVTKFERYSDKQNPKYAYNTAGTYPVTLSISDGSCVSDKTLAIPIVIPDLNGKFDFSAQSTCNKLEVQFTDRSISIPPAKKWKWDFGNGDFSFDQNPKYTYTELGTYYVLLTVGNDDGECTIPLKSGLAFTKPIIDFDVNRPFACINENISFTQTSQYTNYVQWDFGNGVTSSAFSPNASYKATGKYLVSLVAKDNYGCGITVTKPDFITITKPIADFEFEKIIKDCPPLITSFTDKSVSAVKWLWDFGDGQHADVQHPVNTFQYPGIYSVALQVTDQNECIDTKSIPDLVTIKGPTGIFLNKNAINCTNDSVLFSSSYKDAISVLWDFGDGTIEENLNEEVAHKYSIVGKVQPLVLLKDDRGCEVLYKTAAEIFISKSPESGINYSPQFPFEGEEIIFTPTVSGLQFSWNFTDEVFNDQDTVVKIFTDSGSKDVVLEVNDLATGCITKFNNSVLVQGYPDFIPNVFTPNDDDRNPSFEIKGLEKSDWRLVVYNRWGEPVYKSSSYQNDWTGGRQAPGTYYYKLENIHRPEKYYVGYIQVVK